MKGCSPISSLFFINAGMQNEGMQECRNAGMQECRNAGIA
jgi:hypothetical protein